MRSYYQFVEADTGSALQVTCIDEQTLLPINLTGKTVHIRFKIDSGTLASNAMTIINAASGTAQYTFVAGELLPGILNVSIQIRIIVVV